MVDEIDKLLDDFENDIDSIGKEKPNTYQDLKKYLLKYYDNNDSDFFSRTSDYRCFGNYPSRADIINRSEYERFPHTYRYQHIIQCDSCKITFEVITMNEKVDHIERYINVLYDTFFCVKCRREYRVTGKIESVQIHNGGW